MDSTTVEILTVKFEALKSVMDERSRRLWAATEARAIGRGGISRVSEATGIDPRDHPGWAEAVASERHDPIRPVPRPTVSGAPAGGERR